MLAQVVAYQPVARQIMALASMVCFISVVLYGMFLLFAVGSAAAQQKYESDARDIMASLATLEAHYLAASSALTPQKAQELGLVTIPSARVAYVEADVPTLSLRR